MNFSKWVAAANDLRAKHNKLDVTSERSAILAMAQLWSLTQKCPDNIAIAYRNFSEDALKSAALPMLNLLAEGKLGWEANNSPEDCALSIGAQLRALDAELAGRPGFASAPVSEAQYRVKEEAVFVIPRRFPKPLGSRTGPGNSFGRRATPHHRILPCTIKDYAIKLVWDSRLALGTVSAAQEREFGAALMPGMKLEQDTSYPKWVAAAAPCPDSEDLIGRQVDEGFAASPLAIVWPELSMPIERLDHLKSTLNQRSRVCSGERGPTIIAAGSWHDRHGDDVRAVMRILDKVGRERLRYQKRLPYARDGVEEGISLGATIPVLINTDMLISFGICIDFCDRELSLPYHELDIDLVLIASYGNASTMNGHEANADEMRIKYGSRVFVVQQSDGTPGSPLGYVFPEDSSGTVSENRDWSLRTVSFS